MNVFVLTKTAGRRRALEKQPYIVPDQINSLKELIEAVVVREVQLYNEKGVEATIMRFLTDSEIENNSTVGKVHFGTIYNEKKADEDIAKEVALTAFSDGLFRVFINDVECTNLKEKPTICEGDTLCFIRFAFIAGI